MNKIQKITDAIIQQGMLPLYYNEDENVTIEVLRAIYRGGIKAVEYTSRGEAALRNFTKMIEVRNAEMPELLLGIGTIKNVEQAKAYYNIGADFFISPGFVPEVASFLISKGALYIPGCMTPTEIIAAENAGVTFIKLFPGNMLGPDYLCSIKAIFPKLVFMPTGGVSNNEENIKKWFEAGVKCVGLGSQLISDKILLNQDFQSLEQSVRTILLIIQKYKI
jgi:2-dehydro-3-deoxyphosphogluconate aldolase/(4S)-4-hydroxy-2-oxoglutarate aldolase